MDTVNFMSYDATTLTRLLGLAVPLVVAFLAKRTASKRVKAMVNVVASAVVGSTVYLVDVDGGYDWQGFVNAFLNTFVVSIVGYYGLLKPTGVTEKVADTVPNVGVG